MSLVKSKIRPTRPVSVSGEGQSHELEGMLARLDEEWDELKDFLRTQVCSPKLPGEGDAPADQPHLHSADRAAAPPESPGNLPLPHNWVQFAITPREAHSLSEHLEKMGQESQWLERLAKVERQHRRLLALVAFGGVMMLVLLVAFAAVLIHHGVLGPVSLPRLMGAASAPPPVAATPAPAPAAALVAPTPAASPEPAKAASPPAERVAPPPGSTPPPAVAAPSQYVGSVTSNKYHYPHCKWARTIIPKKVRRFASAAQAREAGYVPCPACKPPLTDHLETPATPH